MMDRASKAVRWKPLGECVRLQECAIDLFRAGRQNPMQVYGTGHSVIPSYESGRMRSAMGSVSIRRHRRVMGSPDFQPSKAALVERPQGGSSAPALLSGQRIAGTVRGFGA